MKQYLDVLQEIMDCGVDRPNRTGVPTRGLFLRTLRFDADEGFPAVTTKQLAFKSVKAELLWFLSGSSDVRELRALGSHIWDANAEAPGWKAKAKFEGDAGRIYGVQWRKWRAADGREIDQLGNIIECIKRDPNDRRLIVTAWNPGELDEVCLPPCHLLYQFFVANGELSLSMYQRSCDMFLGVPFNIASYALLLHMVAQVTRLKPKELILILGDVHIYHNHFEQVREQLRRVPYRLPRLWLNPGVMSIDGFLMDDIKMIGYQSHPTIKAELAV